MFKLLPPLSGSGEDEDDASGDGATMAEGQITRRKHSNNVPHHTAIPEATPRQITWQSHSKNMHRGLTSYSAHTTCLMHSKARPEARAHAYDLPSACAIFPARYSPCTFVLGDGPPCARQGTPSQRPSDDIYIAPRGLLGGGRKYRQPLGQAPSLDPLAQLPDTSKPAGPRR